MVAQGIRANRRRPGPYPCVGAALKQEADPVLSLSCDLSGRLQGKNDSVTLICLKAVPEGPRSCPPLPLGQFPRPLCLCMFLSAPDSCPSLSAAVASMPRSPADISLLLPDCQLFCICQGLIPAGTEAHKSCLVFAPSPCAELFLGLSFSSGEGVLGSRHPRAGVGSSLHECFVGWERGGVSRGSAPTWHGSSQESGCFGCSGAPA